jgi:hypothetical protein
MFKKLGRKPAVHTARTKRSKDIIARALAPLGTAPTISDDYVSAVTAATGGDWGILGNDQYGDCVPADDGHYLMLRTANTGTIVIPTEAQVLALYSAETGFNPADPNTDQGTDETSDCEFMVSTGFLGHKADATTALDPTNLNNIKWCIQLFGGIKFGVNLPQSAMDQFDAGKPWGVVEKDGGIIGGHDVLGVKYDGTFFYVVTWGRLQIVDPAWILKYVEEAHALLFADWIAQNGTAPSGLDLQALISDLSQIEQPAASDRRRHRHHRRIKRRSAAG